MLNPGTVAMAICVSPALPPLIKLSFLDEDPSVLWQNCTQHLKEWKRSSSSTAGQTTSEMVNKCSTNMLAKLIWQSNLLEDTIPKDLEEKETIAALTKMYNNKRVDHEGAAGLSQLVQHQVAFKLLMSHDNPKGLTEDVIKETHRIMMKGLYNEQGIPVTNGEYRQSSVHADLHLFPSHKCIPAAMTRIVAEYNQRVSSPDHDPYELASWLHFEVVSLHPFEDGNGRLSRLLWCYSLMKYGLPFPPVLTSGHKKSQRHLVKCLKKDRDCFYSRHPHMTTLTVVSVSLAWEEFLSQVDKLS